LKNVEMKRVVENNKDHSIITATLITTVLPSITIHISQSSFFLPPHLNRSETQKKKLGIPSQHLLIAIARSAHPTEERRKSLVSPPFAKKEPTTYKPGCAAK
jgi:hypothetical protein